MRSDLEALPATRLGDGRKLALPAIIDLPLLGPSMVAPVTGPSRVMVGSWDGRSESPPHAQTRGCGLVSPGPKASPLLGLNLCGWVFEFDDELLELWVLAEVLQIVVGHQAISIFIPAIHGVM